MEDVIKEANLSGFRILNTHIETPGDGIIIFQGMQNHTAESIKSLEGYDGAWVEEAQTFSHNSLELLRPTIRKPNSELWFSWNPRFPTDPVDRLFRGATLPPDAICIEANFSDNPYFPEVLRKEMEWDKSRDPDAYAHVWMGKYQSSSSARVFKNWKIEEFTEPARISPLYGGDWGFAIHPTVLVRGYFEEAARRLCVTHDLSRVGVEIDDTPTFFDSLTCPRIPVKDKDQNTWQVPVCTEPFSLLKSCERPTHGSTRRAKIIMDSADPQNNSYMKRHGYPGVEDAIKGPNSVEQGVKFLQNYDIIVHPRCTAVIHELTFYAYDVDAVTGEVLPTLADKKNHTIDSLRYMSEKLRMAKVKGGLLFRQ
jgi:phage terminase large subunit